MTALYAASAAPLTQATLFAKAYAMASPYRKSKVDRCKFDQDKRLSLAAEVLLQYGLQQAGIAPDAVIVYGEHRKPFLLRSGTEFNLSHSGDYVLCAVSDSAVGCDVQLMQPGRLAAARRFAPAEYAHIMAQPTEAAQNELFYRYWTAKESFLKATGLGLQLPLQEVEIHLGDTVTVRQSVDGRTFCFREYSDLPRHHCTLCAAEDCSDTRLQIINLKEVLR